MSSNRRREKYLHGSERYHGELSSGREIYHLMSQDGHETTLERMELVYDNIGIISALVGACSFTLLSAPSERMTDEFRGTWRLDMFAVCGGLSFTMLLAAVILSVLISNSLRKLSRSKGAPLLLFLEHLGHALAFPTLLFIGGGILLLIDLELYLSMTYSRVIAVVLALFMLCTFACLFRIYLIATGITVSSLSQLHGESTRENIVEEEATEKATDEPKEAGSGPATRTTDVMAKHVVVKAERVVVVQADSEVAVTYDPVGGCETPAGCLPTSPRSSKAPASIPSRLFGATFD